MKSLLLASAALALFSASAFAQGEPGPPPPPPPPPIPGAPADVFFYRSAGPVEVFNKLGHPVQNAPYQAQAVSESTQHLADGNVIQTSNTTKVARDSKGRTWTEQTLDKIGPWSSDQGPHTVIFINDPVAKTSYVLHPDTKTAEKVPANGANIVTFRKGPGGAGPDNVAFSTQAQTRIMVKKLDEAGPTAPGNDKNVTVTDLGTQQINGVAAQGKRTTFTIPANAIGNQLPIVTTSETWYSPELQTVVQSKHDDPRFGETTFSLTNIQKGEPPADLFQVPADYTITSGPALSKVTIDK